MNKEAGDTRKKNFGQKSLFWTAIISLVLPPASGIVIREPYFSDAFVISLSRLALIVHSVSAVTLIIVIMVPVYAALWVRGTLAARVESCICS